MMWESGEERMGIRTDIEKIYSAISCGILFRILLMPEIFLLTNFTELFY